MHILLVEDDPHIARFLQRGLRAEGFLVQHADDGLQGLSMAESSDIDVIILDLLLPGMDGRELCRQLRARDVHTPVLMLSALDRLDDKVHGFSIGADDYLAKPFEFEELLARVRALARRPRDLSSPDQVLRFEDIELNPQSRIVTRAGRTLDLSSLEFTLLQYLMSRPGMLSSRERLLEAVWGVREQNSNVVEVAIRRLREKLDESGKRSVIQTVRGHGYRLVRR